MSLSLKIFVSRASPDHHSTQSSRNVLCFFPQSIGLQCPSKIKFELPAAEVNFKLDHFRLAPMYRHHLVLDKEIRIFPSTTSIQASSQEPSLSKIESTCQSRLGIRYSPRQDDYTSSLLLLRKFLMTIYYKTDFNLAQD